MSEALEYLAAEGALTAARKLQAEVEETIAKLEARLFEGPEERLRTGEPVRSWKIPSFPFRVYYTREGQSLLVLRIYHQARNPIVRRAPAR